MKKTVKEVWNPHCGCMTVRKALKENGVELLVVFLNTISERGQNLKTNYIKLMLK